jgi:hypothetical protein
MSSLRPLNIIKKQAKKIKNIAKKTPNLSCIFDLINLSKMV